MKDPLSKKVLTAFVVLLLAAAGAWAWKTWRYDVFPKRFGVVTPDRLYRSGQLSLRLVKSTLAAHGIKTVVDLQGKKPDGDPEQDAEAQAVRDLGIDYSRYPLGGDGTGDLAHYAAALKKLVESMKAGRPALVHCAAGTQRTGVAVAYYRVLVEGRPGTEAYAEMLRYDWDPERDGQAIDYLNRNMRDLAGRLVEAGVLPRVPDPLPVVAAR